MSPVAGPWLLLVLSLPTQSATGRMRIWRTLKALGCAALRDGAYLLPSSPEHQTELRELADECVREGGSAWVLVASPASVDDAEAYPALFHPRMRIGFSNAMLPRSVTGAARRVLADVGVWASPRAPRAAEGSSPGLKASSAAGEHCDSHAARGIDACQGSQSPRPGRRAAITQLVA